VAARGAARHGVRSRSRRAAHGVDKPVDAASLTIANP
jgi:hypothetical protein